MNEALKPCPFCGSVEIVSEADGSSYDGDMDDMPVCWVICDGCGCGTGEHGSSPDADAAWNRRSDLAGLPMDLVERFKQQYLDENGAWNASTNRFLRDLYRVHLEQNGGER